MTNGLLLFVGWLIVAFAATALGSPDFQQGPEDAIFSATEVVIVSHVKGGEFTVEQSLAGSLKMHDAISLPGFELQQWGMGGDYPVMVRVTPRTRILFFLAADPKDPRKLQVTEDGWGYFFRDVADIDLLRATGEKAIAGKKQWDAIVAMKPSMAKVKALLPYVGRGSSCREMTVRELAKMNPLPGNYLADRLPFVQQTERGQMMLLSQEFPSKRLHDATIADMQGAIAAFDAYLAQRHLDHIDVTDRWNTDLPDSVKALGFEIDYALIGISDYKDPADLPMTRALVPWLLRNQFDREVDRSVEMMSDCPSAENLPVLKAIWENDQVRRARRKAGEYDPIPIDLTRALGATESTGALPTLREIAKIDSAHGYAETAMKKIERGR